MQIPGENKFLEVKHYTCKYKPSQRELRQVVHQPVLVEVEQLILQIPERSYKYIISFTQKKCNDKSVFTIIITQYKMYLYYFNNTCTNQKSHY